MTVRRGFTTTGWAATLAAMIRNGEVSAREVSSRYLDAITELNPSLNAFTTTTVESALEQAEQVDRLVARGEDPGPLCGIPVAVKDNLCTRGIPTTCSSRMLDGWCPPYSATVVEALRQAGAVILGKTNMDEFAMGSSTETSVYGVTHNPYNLERVPGGSSGGSAAAVASGMAVVALGSDTGGSIRQPASLCGVVGMKPTYGTVSRFGLIAFASSLDQVGPFGRSVQDVALAYSVIAGYDSMDSTSLKVSFDGHSRFLQLDDSNISTRGVGNTLKGRLDGERASSAVAVAGRTTGTVQVGSRDLGIYTDEVLNAPVDGIRVGILKEISDSIAPDVHRRVMEAAEALATLGARVDEVSIPELSYALPAYYLIAPAEASSNLARYDGIRYGLRVEDEDVVSMMSATRSSGFGSEVKRRIMLGTYALSAGYYDAYYGQAQRVRTVLIEAFLRAYNDFDVLIGATAPTTAFGLGEKIGDPLTMYMSDVCTIPSNLAGHPSISVPYGTGDDGLPVGVQVLAPALGEPVMFSVAATLERVAPELQPPKLYHDGSLYYKNAYLQEADR